MRIQSSTTTFTTGNLASDMEVDEAQAVVESHLLNLVEGGIAFTALSYFIFMMADSGARGSNQQIKQLAGMRGLMADTLGM